MEKNLIYDVGMNNGDDTAYYLSLGYNVLAIDASPNLANEAKMLFKSAIKENRLEILNVGIASEEGYLDFYLNNKDSVWNSFNKDIGTRGENGYKIIKVKTRSLDQIIREKGVPYYLKIDIEGNDIFCLKALHSCIEKPPYISVELSDPDLMIKLKELGYNKFKIVDQFCFLPLEIPPLPEYKIFRKQVQFKLSMNVFIRLIRKLGGIIINKVLEKQYKHLFSYEHPRGSSGPFGDRLPGKWLSLAEAMNVYSTFKKMHESSNEKNINDFWVDVHATI